MDVPAGWRTAGSLWKRQRCNERNADGSLFPERHKLHLICSVGHKEQSGDLVTFYLARY